MIKLRPRKPDEVIGKDYLKRWHLRRKHGGINVYLHKYLGSDDDRALHDHPWDSVSILLAGNLREITKTKNKRILPLLPTFRTATKAHRIELHSKSALTLFITFRKKREWGFYSSKGWIHWRKYENNGENIE